jgi:hypothetical protein
LAYFHRGRVSQFASNLNFLDFPDADIIVAPVVQPGGFGVRVPGHALRDLDAAAIAEIVRNARGAERVAADGRLDPASAAPRRTMYQTSARDMGLSVRAPVLPIAERNKGPWRSPRIVILDGERDDGADAGEGVGHHGNDGPVAVPRPGLR